MTDTKLLYLNDYHSINNEATVLEIHHENENVVVILDQTLFYPQGGGQPYDTGSIHSSTSEFQVEEVRIMDDVVKHRGHFIKGSFAQHEKVDCTINAERRRLHNRLHSAGHIVDMAVYQLGLNWTPVKGHHFPDNAYVEYDGQFDISEKEQLQQSIEERCNHLIHQNLSTHAKWVDIEELKQVCHFIPGYNSNQKPIRLIFFGANFCIPCGGTHVGNLSEVRHMTIRKIKFEKGKIRVSYQID